MFQLVCGAVMGTVIGIYAERAYDVSFRLARTRAGRWLAGKLP